MNTRADSASVPLASLGERGLVSLIRQRFPDAAGRLHVGIGDDAAVAAPARGELDVLTTDALVEGVHFDLGFCGLADVGYKALAVNVSDVAAMGATPRLALLSLILPPALTIADVEALLDGFAAMADEAGVTLAGGNITSTSGPLVVDVTAIGTVRRRKVLTRSGGRPGDALYVTGTVGAAAAGLGWLQEHQGTAASIPEDFAPCVERYRRPSPRARLGAILGRMGAASACMDLSDGLADAVNQLAEASGTGATVDAHALPIPDAARRWFSGRSGDPVAKAVSGGDDYELLFAVSPKDRGRLRAALRLARGLPVTRIGELTPGPGILLNRDGQLTPFPPGFTHF